MKNFLLIVIVLLLVNTTVYGQALDAFIEILKTDVKMQKSIFLSLCASVTSCEYSFHNYLYYASLATLRENCFFLFFCPKLEKNFSLRIQLYFSLSDISIYRLSNVHTYQTSNEYRNIKLSDDSLKK